MELSAPGAQATLVTPVMPSRSEVVDDVTGSINVTQRGSAHRFFLMSLKTFHDLEYVLIGLMLTPLSFLGVLANVANIAVFTKMGLSSTTNILFFVLSVVDLILLCEFFITSLVVIPAVGGINTLFVDIYDLILLLNPLTWPCFGMGSTVTMLIAVERSVCIMLPLKVKIIFTRRRIIAALIFFSIFAMSSAVQKYATMVLRWRPATNSSHSGYVIVYTEKFLFHGTIGSLVFNVIPSKICFVMVTIATVFMVFKLKERARWRMTSSLASAKSTVSNKEVKVIRSAVFVCAMYIVCFTPNVCIIVANSVEPRFHIKDPYFALFATTVYYVAYFFQGICSSSNIAIYLTTNTKFKETFLKIFRRRQRKGSPSITAT